MEIQFATCDEVLAKRHIIKSYPGCKIDFAAPAIEAVLDLIRRDVVRVTDPDFHRPAIVPSRGYNGDMHAEVYAASKAMHEAIMAMPKRTDAA